MADMLEPNSKRVYVIGIWSNSAVCGLMLGLLIGG